MGTFRPAVALTFDDVLLAPRHSSVHPRDVDVRSQFTRGISLNIPLVSAAMDTVTEAEMAMAIAREGGIGVLHKNMPIDRQAPEGTTLDEAERILGAHRIEKLPVVDRHGVLKGLITVKDIFKRRQHPNANKDQHGRLRVAAAVGGNSKEALSRARALLDAGCDVVVVDSAHGHSQGVLDTVGCLREAFPDAQLVGGNVATGEGARALIERGVDAVKVGRGMGSLGAMEEGSADRYFQDGEVSPSKLVPEGIEGRVPYKGPVADVIFQMVGGLRSGMGYCGVCNVAALRTETEFVRVTSAGLRESHPHDVVITREAPNYSL